MEDNRFERCWSFTQKWEGGSKITKDPDDPGGTTKWGISQRAHPDLDIENLSEEDAKEIAIREYWNPMGCYDLAWPNCLVAFDTAFNLGVSQARDLCQDTWQDALLERVLFYTRIIRKNPILKKYITGWLNRVYDLHKEAIRAS